MSPTYNDLWVPFLLWWVGLFLLWHIPLLEKCKRQEPSTSVSVIIPARNEANRIIPLLQTLQSQSLPAFEVIVVDDHSEDNTAGIASRYGARVLPSAPMPEGWNGKNWACWQGAQRAGGDLFLFLDADIWLEQDALARLASAYQTSGGLVTVQPYHVSQRMYEQMSSIFNIIQMMGMNTFTPLGPRLGAGGAFGPCLLCSREDYERTTGHSAVRLDILEGISLAKVFQAHGLTITAFGGEDSLYFRMYPTGWDDLIEGWSKGFSSGAAAIRPLFMLLSSVWIFGCFDIAINLTQTLISGFAGYAVLPGLLYLLYAGQIRWMLKRIGHFKWWASLLFPLPLLFFALIMLRSFVMVHIMGRVSWHGRKIKTT